MIKKETNRALPYLWLLFHRFPRQRRQFLLSIKPHNRAASEYLTSFTLGRRLDAHLNSFHSPIFMFIPLALLLAWVGYRYVNQTLTKYATLSCLMAMQQAQVHPFIAQGGRGGLHCLYLQKSLFFFFTMMTFIIFISSARLSTSWDQRGRRLD